MILSWSENGWDDYLYWQKQDKKLKRINDLLKDIKRTPFSGLGNPEPLKQELSGFYSRRIDQEHRLVYKVDDKGLLITQCRYHY